MTRRGRIHVGDLVRSHYRARWIGRVIAEGEERRAGLLLVQPLLTPWGGLQGRHIKPRWLHPSWLRLPGEEP